MTSIGEKQEIYKNCYKLQITPGIPIILKINIRNYKKILSFTQKPFDNNLTDVLSQTAMYVISQIQDAVFGYYHNDEINIIIISNNESENWLNNDLQSIVSIGASLATAGFRESRDIWGDELQIPSKIIFEASVWGLPNTEEVLNYLVHRQDSSIKHAINRSVWYHLEERMGYDKAYNLLSSKSYDDKEDILLNYCGIDLYDFYDSYYIFGIALYKIREIKEGASPKNRWYMNKNIPNFIDDKEFISAIISNGSDIFRASQLLNS